MSTGFSQLLGFLQQLLESFLVFTEQVKELKAVLQSAHVPDRPWLKEEVMAYLRISDRSYERYKQQGLIQVMRLGGQDYVDPRTLQAALQKSVQKGRY